MLRCAFQCSAMANLPRWALVWTESNFSSFQNYLTHYATPDEIPDLLQLPMKTHRSNPPPFGPQPTNLHTVVDVHGVPRYLPEIPCDEAVCDRCREGRGGYQFRWVDSRWTPAASCDMTVDKATHWRNVTKHAWPVGMRYRPSNPLQ